MEKFNNRKFKIKRITHTISLMSISAYFCSLYYVYKPYFHSHFPGIYLTGEKKKIICVDCVSTTIQSYVKLIQLMMYGGVVWWSHCDSCGPALASSHFSQNPCQHVSYIPCFPTLFAILPPTLGRVTRDSAALGLRSLWKEPECRHASTCRTFFALVVDKIKQKFGSRTGLNTVDEWKV